MFTIQDLTGRYEGVSGDTFALAVDRINLTVRGGEFIVIIVPGAAAKQVCSPRARLARCHLTDVPRFLREPAQRPKNQIKSQRATQPEGINT
jgi:hypothetical protein